MGRPTLLIDVGANADCKPEYLVQFAQMGEVYMNAIMGVERPKVGLLNIGEEDTKGDLFAQEAHRLLTEAVPAFAGNAEGGGPHGRATSTWWSPTGSPAMSA